MNPIVPVRGVFAGIAQLDRGQNDAQLPVTGPPKEYL